MKNIYNKVMGEQGAGRNWRTVVRKGRKGLLIQHVYFGGFICWACSLFLVPWQCPVVFFRGDDPGLDILRAKVEIEGGSCLRFNLCDWDLGKDGWKMIIKSRYYRQWVMCQKLFINLEILLLFLCNSISQRFLLPKNSLTCPPFFFLGSGNYLDVAMYL